MVMAGSIRPRPQPADDGAHRRPAVFAGHRRARRLVPGEAAVEDIAGVQVGDLRHAERGELIGDLRLQGQRRADFDARHIGGDGAEIAAVLDGRQRLHIVGIEVRRPAAQMKHHDQFRARRVCGNRFEPQQVGERQPAQRQRSHTKGRAAINAVGGVRTMVDLQHGNFLGHFDFDAPLCARHSHEFFYEAARGQSRQSSRGRHGASSRYHGVFATAITRQNGDARFCKRGSAFPLHVGIARSSANDPKGRGAGSRSSRARPLRDRENIGTMSSLSFSQ